MMLKGLDAKGLVDELRESVVVRPGRESGVRPLGVLRSDEFLDGIAHKDKPNLQMGMLRELLSDEIRTVQRTNLVQARRFSEQLDDAIKDADVLISTAALVYLEPDAVENIMDAFAANNSEGYLLVNFLNPFALEAADATKRTLLERFEFVGSMASRHRLMSELERSNYPGEEWVMLEIWVLKRKK
jgi:hypothetical protein